MKIRELAELCHVSTSTVLRFCGKMGCNGFTEFRYALKNAQKLQAPYMEQNFTRLTIDYLEKAERDMELQAKLKQAADILLNAKNVVFYGVGSSGALCQYGARFFSNVGVYATYMNDPFYPQPKHYFDSAVMMVLSVSGETEQVIRQVAEYKRQKTTIISITNSDKSTIARISDLNFATYMPFMRSHSETNDVDLTPQIPTLFILESLGRRLQDMSHKI